MLGKLILNESYTSLPIKARTIKLLEESHGKYFCDLRSKPTFFEGTQKSINKC